MSTATGYGPSPSHSDNNDRSSFGATCSASPRPRLLFDGDERKYSLWEVKFLAFMKLRNLDSVFKNLDEESAEIDQNKSEEAYAEPVQVLDDRSLSLIIRDAER